MKKKRSLTLWWPQNGHYKKFLLIMKMIIFILFVSLGTLQAEIIYSQKTHLNLDIEDETVKEILRTIENKSDFFFLYNSKLIDANRKTSISVKDERIDVILKILFKDTEVVYKIIDKQIILTNKDYQIPFQDAVKTKIKEFTVNGVVTDASNNQPLVGVNIHIQETKVGTISDLEGKYSITVPDEKSTLVFSYLGYITQTISLEGRTQLNVQMALDETNLEEVIVTALGIKREEKALGYSVQKVDGETFQTVKVADMTTSLTGKVSGLLIKNSTNFGTDPIINLRGEPPLIVVDGIPSDNVTINDLSPDDIENISILKGATASALYGYRGTNGAIMISTIRGNKEKGLSVSFNSSTMFSLGFIVTPKTQSSYSSGFNGTYNNDYIWGDKLDIGRTATLWDPYEKVWKENTPLVSKGKNNLKNFQQTGYILNNNLSISSQGENSTIRSSISYVYNQGQFPNQKLNKITYSLGGQIKFNDLTLETNISYSKHTSPNVRGSQYSGGYLYNLIGWLGAEWDVRDYKDYWLVKDVSQNWFNYEWYDNPYFLANEVIKSSDRDIFNGYISANYQFTPWLKLSLRSGIDSYLDRYIARNPIGARNAYSYYGYYSDQKYTGYSINNDLILSVDKSFGKFRVETMLGGTLFFAKDDAFTAETEGGLSVPGFYSLKASVDPIGWETSLVRKQVNSLYGRATLSWANLAFVDITGRNDWSSTLSEDNRSYFYPSIAGSLLISEIMPKVSWLDLWKVRASWTISKIPAGVYDINSAYIVENEVWGGFNSAYYPSEIRGSDVKPQTIETYEVGTAANFFKNRLRVDLTLFQMNIFDFLASASISDATGFTSKYVNTKEERVKKGIEITLGGTPVQTDDWKWDVTLNWSKDATYYNKLDEQYSPDELWVYEGARVDAYTVSDWMRDPSGNLIHDNGFPVRSNYSSVQGYSNPEWMFGLGSSLKYKNFTFSFTIDGRMGGVSFSRLDALLWNSGAHTGTDNQWRYDEVVNGLQNYVGQGVKVISGDVVFDSYGRITSDTRVYAPNDVQVSYESYVKDNYQRGAWSWCSQDILEETFFKLREVSISYVFPKSIGNKLKMKDLVFSLIGQNLFYWGKEYKLSDPDYGGDWDLISPSIRYAGFSLKFNL